MLVVTKEHWQFCGLCLFFPKDRTEKRDNHFKLIYDIKMQFCWKHLRLDHFAIQKSIRFVVRFWETNEPIDIYKRELINDQK
jgi:hypothetical protein